MMNILIKASETDTLDKYYTQMSDGANFNIMLIIIIINITINRDHNINMVHSVWRTLLHNYQRSKWSVDSKATQSIQLLISSVMKDWEASFFQKQCSDSLQPNFLKNHMKDKIVMSLVQTFLNKWIEMEFLFQWKTFVSRIH